MTDPIEPLKELARRWREADINPRAAKELESLLPALEAFWRSWFCKHHLPTKPHPQGTCFVCNASVMLRSQSLRFAAEIDWWHRYWHRDTGIPCDGTMEVCKRAERCRTEHMPGLNAHDAEVWDRAAKAICCRCDENIPGKFTPDGHYKHVVDGGFIHCYAWQIRALRGSK